ncbi:MAG: SH3 domain-containing C40 family peptidase [Clostridiales bacterium]|nr:SH3 domain-containing C40 family peptidase [Clostridiales bacterium]
MRNLKHTIIAIAAIVMVGTLSFFQVSDMSAQRRERDMRLSTANQIENITITSTESEEGSRGLALTSSYEDVQSVEEPVGVVDLATEQAIAEKSYLTLGYAKVAGSAALKTEPNEDSATIGTMNGAEQVEILESTEGWYKIMADGQSGYVKSELVTLDKGDAEETALQYDHYKKANVTAASGLTVRATGSESAASLGSVNDGDNVIVVDQEGDYIKILYGNDYKEGYVINTGLETTGEWVEKNDVHSEIKRIAAEKAEAARKEEIARQNAKKASSGYVTSDSAATTESASSSSSSGKGQAIVNSAMKYLGVPYVWGGTSPGGFDCSGLVQYVCNQNGISVPRVAASQRGAGQYVSRENLQPGDLVFFSRGGGISHVGIYVGNGNMIHAPQTGDVVKISSIETSYRISSYAGAVRVW